MTLGEVLAPAIELAERGFPVSPVASGSWHKGLLQVGHYFEVHSLLPVEKQSQWR